MSGVTSGAGTIRLVGSPPSVVARGLYRVLREQIIAIWDAGWTRTDVSVYWRGVGPVPLPDPSSMTLFMDNEIEFGREAVRAFGGGPGANDRVLFGTVILRVFIARAMMEEDDALDVMDAAAAVFRSLRSDGGNLSFIGGSSFDVGPTEDGNWFGRGQTVFYEFRFTG